MKKPLVTLALVIYTVMMMTGQTSGRDKSVYLEFLGPSNMVGVSYDARFNGNDHWGYRVGLGYTYGMVDVMLLGDSESRAFSVPVEINYLVGNNKHRIELGLGASAGLYHASGHILDEPYSDTTFGYFFYGNVGYRLTARNGFQFRCGFTPSFTFGGDDAVSHDTLFYPYISLGYAF